MGFHIGRSIRTSLALQSVMGYPLLAVYEGNALFSNKVDRAESLLWTQTHHLATIKKTVTVRCLYEAALIDPALAHGSTSHFIKDASECNVGGVDAMCIADRSNLSRPGAPTEDARECQPRTYLTHREGHFSILFGAVQVLSFVHRLAKVSLKLVVVHIVGADELECEGVS